MAALLAPAPQPAEAQTDDWRSWNPTLTVKDKGGGSFGCSQTAGADACSTAISDPTFIIGGNSITLDSMSLISEILILNFTQDFPNRLYGGYLQVGSKRFYLSPYVITGTSVSLPVPGITWSADDKVRFRLHPPTDIANFEGILTVQNLGSGAFGCNDANSSPQRFCGGNSGVMSVNLFNLNGASYYITKLEIRNKDHAQNNRIYIEFDREVSRALHEDYMLSVDGHILAFPYPAPNYTWGPWAEINSIKTFPFKHWQSGNNSSRVKIKFVKKNPPAPVTGAATPLQILSASRTSVREGDAPITITARLARNAKAERVIPISHEQMHGKTPPRGLELAKLATACDDPNNAEKDYTFAPAAITIAEGQRTGQATLTVCDDNVEDTNEYIYLHPGRVPNEAYPASGSGVYQIRSLRITILNDETGTGGNGGTDPDPVEQQPTPTPQQQRAVPQPAAITLRADPQAAANGGPVTVTARLDRPTAPGMTVRLNLVEGLGTAWWDQCEGTPPRTYPGTWGGKVIEIPAGGQEATAELCVARAGGPGLVIGATADPPRLDAKDLSLPAPAGLALRSLTVSSTDSAEGLPENAVELSDASNDYNYLVPRAVSSVTVQPAAAYETTSVRVNGRAVDDTTPSVDVPLDVGDNTIRIEVRAPAVPAVREYTLTVTRMEASTDRETQVLERPECEADTGPLCGIALSAGSESVEFSPDFARDTTSYRATVPAGTTSVTLTPDYAEGTSVFAGSRNGGTTYTRPTRVRPSGTAVELALAPGGGATELWLMVSGSGGMTTYSIHVTEATPEPKTYSVSAASTAAEGANATLTVTLSEAAPTGGVALTVTASYSGQTATADDVGSIASPVTVAAGDTTLDIAIPTVDDDVDEDDETFTVTISATTSGWEKAGDGRDTATVTITDDDTAGVTVTPTTLSVAEDGSATYTVTLDSRPTADVTVTVTSGDDGAASVSPASYTFTPSGWNISQIFIVSGVADADTDDESVTISHGAASSDAGYHGIAVASVAVSVTDDTPEQQQQQQQQTAEPVEIPGPVVNLQLTAKGEKIIVSWEAPASGGAVGNYIAHIKNTDTGKGKDRKVAAGKTTTTFRNLKAGAAYRVWVRAQNEAGKGERVHARTTLPDGVVQGGEGDPPPEQQQVAKTYSVTATASAAEGNDAALAITLSEAAPAGGAAFTVTAGYGGGSTATADDVGSITSPVTVAEGETALDITIPTADDAVDEDDETFTVTIATTATGWEKAGDGQDTATVTITDDDTAGVTVTHTTLSVAEDGSATYTVVLDSRPTADVTVTPTGGDDGASSVAPASHTFTPSDWNTPQTFTVSGVADEDTDNESVTVSHRATSGDGKYDGIAADSVTVSVSDTTRPPAQEPATASCPEETEPPVPGQKEPFNVCVTPGDGTLTVTWTVAPRDGFEDGEIRHALRWSQEPGVWANPTGPNAVGPNDGISVEGGVYTYTITGLENGVATGVFVRSFTGGDYNEGSAQSSKWVRVKGENTTPKADG